MSGWLICSDSSFNHCSACAISASRASELRGSGFLMTLTRPAPAGADLFLLRPDPSAPPDGADLPLPPAESPAGAGADLCLVCPGPSATAEGSDLSREGVDPPVADCAALQS